MLSGNAFLTQMGFAVAFGIVVAAFVMAMFFTPSLTALIGHAAWWPGHADRAVEPVGGGLQHLLLGRDELRGAGPERLPQPAQRALGGLGHHRETGQRAAREGDGRVAAIPATGIAR